jgi:peptidyl-prolyl cis-trans isomerase B (cyclophilin B)
MNYTVFGEVESGLEVVDKIAATSRDSNNRPFNDIKMKMRILKRR